MNRIIIGRLHALIVSAGAVFAPVSLVAQAPGSGSAPAGPGGEAAIPGPSFEAVIGLRDAGSAVISPDGRSVAYTVRSADWEENGYDTEIWLAREDEAPFQLTRTTDGSSTSPAWSPDGRWLAFLADRGEAQQIHLIRPDGGEAWPLTEVEEGVGGFEWSPDGRRIAFLRTEPESPEDEAREERFGAFAVEDAEYRMRHLWVVALPEEPGLGRPGAGRPAGGGEPGVAAPERLTEGDAFTVGSFAWSPDGSTIAFDHRPDPLINSWMRADISLLDVATREITPLVTDPGFDGSPRWSPDGGWILYGATGPDLGSAYYTNARLFKIPATGGQPVRLAADLDEDPSVVDWNRRGIFLTAWQKTRREVFRVDPETGRTSSFLTHPERVWSIDFSEDVSAIAVVGRTAESLDEVYRATLPESADAGAGPDDRGAGAASVDAGAGAVPPGELVRVTDQSAQIDGWTLGTSEVISWTSEDGTTIEGVLHRPDDFDPSRRYPLFVVIHGGPTGIDYPTAVAGYVYPIHQWLAKGALVLRPNYRGSAGYGEAFRSLNVRNLGVGDAWDVLSGVRHLVDRGIVDESRIGAMGWSQGGYISAYLTTTADRFAAISVGAGISNWVTYYVNTDIHPFTRQYLKATPWEDPEIYAKTSPMTFIRDASTPTLIQHGEFDRRVPIPNAYELYQGLRDVGVETKLIVYEGFGHGIDKPKERLAALWHNWQWFGRHIWGEEIELPVDVEPEETAGVEPDETADR